MTKFEILAIIIGFIFVGGGVTIIYGKKTAAAFLSSEKTQAEIKKWCITAEQYIVGTKKGQERLELVCARLRDYLPAILKPLVTTKMLVDAVNFVFEKIAVKLENGTKVAA